MVRIFLKKDGTARQHQMDSDQVSVDSLRRLFNVQPQSTWLRDSLDDTPYFPNPDNGSFDLSDVIALSELIVEGPLETGLSQDVGRRQSIPVSSNTVISTPPPLPPPLFRSVVAPKRAVASCSLKIVRADIHVVKAGRQKPEFEQRQQMFIEVTESTANIEFISATIKRKWGSDYCLVTNDGIELEDSPATQGLGFWKNPRRKLFAVSRKQLGPQPCSSRNTTISDSEDSDVEPTPKKRSKRDSMMESMLNDIQEIKGSITEISTLSSHSKVPLGLMRILQGTFQCNICHKLPIKPPVILMKCCKQIVGCEECMNQWFSGASALTKACPLCRCERGYNETLLVRGLDDFLIEIARVLDDESDRGSMPEPSQE